MPTQAKRKPTPKTKTAGTRSKTRPPAAKKKAKSRKAKKRGFTAKGADRHMLYQLAVQSPEEDAKFLARVYTKVRGKKPKHFREDFCGTALLASTWIRQGKERTAEGFDICGDTIAWGMANNFEPLGEKAERVKLHVKDVREPSHKQPDVRCAQNFSYMVFKTRAEMREYMAAVYKDLTKDGVFVMDIYGGPESMEEMEEVSKIEEGFTFVWDQAAYWPATGDYKAHIHFRFKDGTQLKRAFSYEWRLWHLTELVDLLQQVGFKQIDQYWEGTDEDGESGNGIFRKSRRGENCQCWVTYLVAYK